MREEKPILPEVSTALDRKVCTPSESPVAEYVQAAAEPPVTTKLPPSTEIFVDTKLESDDVPVKPIVEESEYELSAGVEIVEIGLVVSSKTVLSPSKVTPSLVLLSASANNLP